MDSEGKQRARYPIRAFGVIHRNRRKDKVLSEQAPSRLNWLDQLRS